MKTGILLQARCDSRRFPKKILEKINNKTMLETVVDRLNNINKTKLIIVTTKKKNDDKVLQISKKLKVKCFRGKTSDVLSRFYEAALKYKLNTIIRCNADCPLIDRKLLIKMLKKFKNNKFDYISNILDPTYPSGLHVEIFNFKSLKKAHENALTLSDREHVTPYIYKNSKKFKIFSVKNKKNLSFHRWTVDYIKDLKFIKEIYKELDDKNNFEMKDIIKIIKNKPNLKKINYSIEKKQNLLIK